MSYPKCKIGILWLKYATSKKHKVAKYTFNSEKKCMKNQTEKLVAIILWQYVRGAPQ